MAHLKDREKREAERMLCEEEVENKELNATRKLLQEAYDEWLPKEKGRGLMFRNGETRENGRRKQAYNIDIGYHGRQTKEKKKESSLLSEPVHHTSYRDP